MVDKEMVISLVSQLNVMKPNKAKKENLKQVLKMEEILKSPDYAAEMKYDGCRYFMLAGYFFSSEHVEKTENFPHLKKFFQGLNMPNLVIDGEIFYPGKTSQFCTRVTGADPNTAIRFQEDYGKIKYVMWDMLRTPKGTWLLKEPFRKRRQMLEYFYNTYIKGTAMEEHIELSELEIEDKIFFKDRVLAAGLEGIVLKHLDSLYIMGKKPMWAWMKIKQENEDDFIIIGYDPPTKEYSGTDFDGWPYWRDEGGVLIPVSKYYYHGWIGAIKLGAYVNGELTHVATTSGFDEETRRMFSESPDEFLQKVVKVGYMEKTEAGYPRHPKFLQFHESKQPEECVWELND